jgi:hypothetical protein
MGAENSDKEPKAQSGGPLAFLVKLSSSSLTIIGALYLIGYVIVNGYQTKYLNYSSNALQLKHVATGTLYVFLTLSEGLIMTFCFVDGFVTWAEWRDASRQTKADPSSSQTKTGWLGSMVSRFSKPVYSHNSVLAFLEVWGQACFKALTLVGIVFTIIGVAVLPSESPLRWSSFRGFLGWTAINLLVSLVLAYTLYKFHRDRFEAILKQIRGSEKTPEKTEEPSNSEEENVTVTEDWVRETRRRFIEARIQSISIALGLGFLSLLSLVWFQGVYGRLKPDYGGGALYRVALHLASENRLPDRILEGLQAQGSSLLLVDRDDKFVYILRVDKSGAKNLFQINTSGISALEVLQEDPIHPDDAVYHLRHASSANTHP